MRPIPKCAEVIIPNTLDAAVGNQCTRTAIIGRDLDGRGYATQDNGNVTTIRIRVEPELVSPIIPPAFDCPVG